MAVPTVPTVLWYGRRSPFLTPRSCRCLDAAVAAAALWLVLQGTAAVVATQELVLRRGWALEPEGSVLRLVLWPGTGPGGQDGAGGVDGTLERRCGRTRWTAGGTAPPVTVVPGLQLRIRRPPSKA